MPGGNLSGFFCPGMLQALHKGESKPVEPIWQDLDVPGSQLRVVPTDCGEFARGEVARVTFRPPHGGGGRGGIPRQGESAAKFGAPVLSLPMHDPSTICRRNRD